MQKTRALDALKRKRKANKKLFPDYDVSTTDEPEDSIAGKKFKF